MGQGAIHEAALNFGNTKTEQERERGTDRAAQMEESSSSQHGRRHAGGGVGGGGATGEDGRSLYTVEDALRAVGFGKFQALMLAYSGMGYVAEAMEVMLLSFVGPAVQSEWKLSSHKESLISSVVFVGMLLGAYTWGIVSDNYGRR